jgi:hypothetical protein
MRLRGVHQKWVAEINGARASSRQHLSTVRGFGKPIPCELAE